MEKQECLEATVCREIGARTGGEILIGVVGPVRTGKSTLIKQFMEQLVLPAIGPADAKLRARDELPQSAAGRTIMTTEPKFIPEQAVPLQLEGGGECRIRLIDCVGYMVEGAMGHEEDEKPRMVKSPWFEEEIPFDLAAETGTRKVIRDHFLEPGAFDHAGFLVLLVAHGSFHHIAHTVDKPDTAFPAALQLERHGLLRDKLRLCGHDRSPCR